MFRLKSLISSLLLASIAGGCSAKKDALATSNVQDVSSDLNKLKPELGRAYNAYTAEYLAHSCLDTSELTADDYVVIPPNLGDIEYKYDMTSDQVRKSIKGSIDAKIEMSSLTVEGEMQIEQTGASDDLSATVNLISHASEGRYRIKESSMHKIKLNEYGKSVRDASYDSKERAKRCGTGFLQDFELSATFIATMRFEFGSQTDKDFFMGKLRFVTDQLEAGGQITLDNLNISNHATVSVKVSQLGGDVTQLGQALNDDINSCSAQAPAICLKAMQGLNTYLKDIFPQQFTYMKEGQMVGPASPDPFRYFIRNPTFRAIATIDTTFDGIVPSPEQVIAMREVRTTLNDKFLDELRDKNRARAVVQSGLVKTLAHRNKLMDLQTQFDRRMKVVADAIAACYKINDDIGPCERAVVKYDHDILQYPVDYSLMVILPQSFEDYCGMLKTWHTVYFGSSITGSNIQAAGNPNAAEQDLEGKTRQTLVAMLNIDSIKQAQEGRTFVADLANDIDGTWTPAGQLKRADTSPYWNCPRLGEMISYMNSPVSLVDQKLHNIEPIASFADVEVLDLSNNRIQAGIAAIGKLEYLTSLKATDSKIKSLKGIANGTLVNLDLANNLIASEELVHLSGMRGIEQLVLSGNRGIIDLNGLGNFPRLTQLNVRETSISKEAMTKFLTEYYVGLVGKPRIFWDTDACAELKEQGIANADKLSCEG